MLTEKLREHNKNARSFLGSPYVAKKQVSEFDYLKKDFEQQLLSAGVCTEKELPLIKEQFKLDGTSKGVFSIRIESFPITRMSTDAECNRQVRQGTKAKVKAGLVKFGGFDVNSFIILDIDEINEDGHFKISDGQNRHVSATELGYTSLPVVFYKFPDKTTRLDFVKMVNTNKSSLTKKASVHIDAFREKPVPSFAYKVYNDPEYPFLHRKIELEKNIDTETKEILPNMIHTGSIPITYSQLEHILNVVLFNRGTEAQEKNKKRLADAVAETDYDVLATLVNFVVGLYYECFNYKDDSIRRAFYSFVACLLKQDLIVLSFFMHNKKKIESFKKRMFRVTYRKLTDYKKDRSKMMDDFKVAYNYRLQKNKVV